MNKIVHRVSHKLISISKKYSPSLRQCMQSIHSIVKADKLFITLIVILNTPYPLYQLLQNPLQPHLYLSTFLLIVFAAVCIDLIIKAVHPILLLYHSLRISLILLNVFLYLLDTFMVLNYRCLPDRAMVAVIMSTNGMEASAFVTQFIVSPYFLLQFVWYLGFLVVLFFLLSTVLKGYQSFIAIITAAIIVNRKEIVSLDLDVLSITRFAKLVPSALQQLAGYKRIRAMLDSHKVEILENKKRIPYFCLILGESIARHRMSLYGYKLKTSPLLEARYRKQELFVFTDVICAYANTLESIKLMFSFLRQDDTIPWPRFQNLFEILKAADYHSVWLSNQEITGHGVQPARFFADTCSERHYTMIRDSGYSKYSPYDDALLPLLDHTLKRKGKPIFHLLHTYGAHVRYDQRYPPQFGRFRQYDELPSNLTETKRKVQAFYDNAVLYDDYIIDSIINRYEDKDAVVLFVSDHGEEVFDSPNTNAGHDGYKQQQHRRALYVVACSASTLN